MLGLGLSIPEIAVRRAGLSGSTPAFTALGPDGTAYTVPLTVLGADGTPYVVSSAVLGPDGTSYTPI